MSSNDPRDNELGDRVKSFEGVEAKRFLLPGQPVMVRLDGRSFSRFTQGLSRPFDRGLRDLMVATARACAEESNALLAYTQSDEISLVLPPRDPSGNQGYFGGRVSKITSCLAARCSVVFNHLLPQFLPSKSGDRRLSALPVFDCRVWTVPTRHDAVEAILWREVDARVNAISMATRAHFSAKQMEGVSSQEMKKMLQGREVEFRDYPVEFRRGTYLQRRVVVRQFSPLEMADLPPRHKARTDPELMFARNELRELNMPPFARVANPEEVLFEGADPVLRDEKGKESELLPTE